GDRAGETRRAQVFAEGVVGDLAPDERVAHLPGAVADAIGGGDGVLRLDQPQLELARPLADPAFQPLVNRFDLGDDAEVALAVALRAHHADRWLVNEFRIGAERARDPNGLRRAARVVVDDHDIRFRHSRLLPAARRVRSR